MPNRDKEAEIHYGVQPGTTDENTARIAELEREVRELRRTNEILQTSAASSRPQDQIGHRVWVQAVVEYIDADHDRIVEDLLLAVEPIREVVTDSRVRIASSTYDAAKAR